MSLKTEEPDRHLPLYEQLRRNPLVATLTLKFTVYDPKQVDNDIFVETIPSSRRESWNIRALFDAERIPLVPGTYVFEHSVISGFKTFSCPKDMDDTNVRRLQSAFTSVMLRRVGELVDLFNRFPSQKDLEQLATLIVETLHAPALVSLLLGSSLSTDKPRNVKVIPNCPHRTALNSVLEGRGLETILEDVIGSASSALLTRSGVNWAAKKGNTEVHVSLQDHGNLFAEFVNGALAQELAHVLQKKERELALETWRRLVANSGANQAKADTFAKQWGFTAQDF